jgi:hypothetical protein
MWKDTAVAHRLSILRSSADEGSSNRCCLGAYVVLCVSRTRTRTDFVPILKVVYQQLKFCSVEWKGGVENGVFEKL